MVVEIEMYREQILWGKMFLTDFSAQLKTLYNNGEFMAIIHRIQSQAPAQESPQNIEKIKQVAKTMLYNERVAWNFEPLMQIVNEVVKKGGAKNSALISVYCAMRLFELSDKEDVSDVHSKVDYNNELDFRLKWKTEYRCEDGHYVRSKNEALVDNWLYHHFVPHAYEKAVFSANANYTFCSDFYLPQYKLFIEIWGMNTAEYEARKKRKIDFYRNSGNDLLQISGDDIKNLDDILSKKIRTQGKK